MDLLYPRTRNTVDSAPTPMRILPRQTTTSTPLTKEDNKIDELTKQFNELKIMLVNLQKAKNRPPRVQRFNTNSAEIVTQRCFRCGEEGHYPKECLSETRRVAQPRTNNPTQVNAIESVDDDWDVEGDELFETYPVERQPKFVDPDHTPERRQQLPAKNRLPTNRNR